MNRSLLTRTGAVLMTAALMVAGAATSASAADTGTVRGTFVSDDGAPLTDAYVSVYDTDYSWLAGEMTGADGTYTINGLPAGPVKVQFESSGGLRQWAHRAADFDGATEFRVTGGATLTVDERRLATGMLTGTVTDPATGAVPSYVVAAERVDATGYVNGYADENGHYALEVTTGDWQISFTRGAVPQWATGTFDRAQAATFSVAAGQTVQVDDVFLPTGSIGGTLLRADGSPMIDASVYLYRDGEYVTSTYTDWQTGGYGFDMIPPGEYTISYTLDGTTVYLPGTQSPSRAETFTVVAGQRTVADATQRLPGAASGTLTGATGGYEVELRSPDENVWETYTARTAANGTWRVANVPADDYLVSFVNPGGTRRQYAYGQTDPAAATLITVPSAGTATVDDTWLPGANLIVEGVDAATGASVGEICVWVYPSDGNGCGAPAGLTDLPAGPVTLDVSTASNSSYLRAADVPVTLVAGETTRISVPLDLGGRVSATVVDRATGQPVRRTCLALIEPGSGGLPDGFPYCTNAQGKLTTQAMATGTYQIFAAAPTGYGHQWAGPAGGTGDQREAARIKVKPGKTVKAPAILLDAPGTVTGIVTDPAGEPLESASVSYHAWGFGSGPTGDVETDEHGRYTMDDLGPYAWPLVVTPYRGLPRQWSGGTANRFQATTVAVTSGATSTFDLPLIAGSALTGTVTVDDDVVRPDGWRLTAVNATTGDQIGVADWVVQADGTYRMRLPGGQPIKIHWYVSSADPNGSSGWWENAADQASATKVTVPRAGEKELNLTIG